MEKYHDIGTSININVLNWIKCLPTRNFQEASFPYAEKVSCEMFVDNQLSRRLACAG